MPLKVWFLFIFILIIFLWILKIIFKLPVSILIMIDLTMMVSTRTAAYVTFNVVLVAKVFIHNTKDTITIFIQRYIRHKKIQDRLIAIVYQVIQPQIGLIWDVLTWPMMRPTSTNLGKGDQNVLRPAPLDHLILLILLQLQVKNYFTSIPSDSGPPYLARRTGWRKFLFSL